MSVDVTLPVDSLMAVLRRDGAQLFQLRKVGVTMAIPAALRDQVVMLYGEEARSLLRLVDGDVRL